MEPITGIADCCARTATGHAAAVPPSAARNSRRPMVTVIRPSRARCVWARYHATSVQSSRSRRAVGRASHQLLGALQALNWSLRASTLAFAVALVAAFAVSVRLTILLPALAVEAPGATPSHALADTKGQALRILALFFLALLPWISANIGGLLLLGPRVQIVGTPQAITSLVMGGVLQTITLALTAVIASYAFMALAARVKRAAQPQAPA